MKDEPKIVYNGIAIYVNDAVKPDELWALSGNWRDMFMVKQQLNVSRAMWKGSCAISETLQLGRGSAARCECSWRRSPSGRCALW